MRILVADGSATMRRIVVNSLKRVGFPVVVEAADGATAVSLSDASVDLVITSWRLPGMSGVEFTRLLRARAGGASIPILMVFPRPTKADMEAARAAGVSVCLVKPFTPQTLKLRIDQYIPTPAA